MKMTTFAETKEFQKKGAARAVPVKRYIVSVFDDRFVSKTIAMRNVRVALPPNTPVDAIAATALAEVYESVDVSAEHCTHVLIYPADEMFRVIDGDTFTPVLYREGKE